MGTTTSVSMAEPVVLRDDTLWDNRTVLMAAEQAVYDWLAENYPRIAARYSMEDLRQLRIELVRENPDLRNRISELRRQSLRLAARSADYDDSLVEPAFAVFLEARHRITLYDDVTPALQRLRAAGYRLGSLTNGNADVIVTMVNNIFTINRSINNGKAF